MPLGDEPLSIPEDPNNEYGVNLRINMGAYGGTAEASIAPHGWVLLADMTNDGIVDLRDFAHTGAEWQSNAARRPCDLNRNGAVNASDLGLLAEDWLKQTTWHK